MKPNRSSSRTNLVAGSWLLLMTFLALIPLNFLYASQANDKDLAQPIFDTMDPGDPTNDALIVWPDDRKTIELGTITITTVDPNTDAAQKALAFDPTRLTNGMELNCLMTRCPLCAPRCTGCQESIARVSRDGVVRVNQPFTTRHR